MRKVAYELVDVFTDQPFGGNQLAVFLDADGLDGATMQTLAAELNLSESVFVLSAQDETHDYHLRIFTPRVELPMAGHPTVGAAYTLFYTGRISGQSKLRCLEGVGIIDVQLVAGANGGVAAHMGQPVPAFGHIVENREKAAAMLSLDESDLMPDLPVQVVSSGVPFLYVPVRNLDAIRRAAIRVDVWEAHFREHVPGSFFVFTMETHNADSTAHARMFAPSMGIAEDPATGAASGPFGAYLTRYGLAGNPQHIISEQGFEMGRPSLIYISVQSTGDDIHGVTVGGTSQHVGAGYLLLTD